MNKLVSKILSYCGTEVKRSTRLVSCYLPDDNRILLSVLEETLPTNLLKQLAGRPSIPGFTLAHETGHAFFTKKKVHKSRKARELFGDFCEVYRGREALYESFLMPSSEGYVTRYAATHPTEDFADCFAVLVLNDNRIPRSVTGDSRKKMAFIQELIKKSSLD